MKETTVPLHVLADGGCEQYINMTVVMSNEECSLPKRDRTCRRKIKLHVGDRPFTCVRGTMTARWKSEVAREMCKNERMANGRWQDVQKYAADLVAGDKFPPGMFVHPSLTGRSDGLLVPIDGARRLMAHLETGATQIPVVIIRRNSLDVHQAASVSTK